MNSLCSSRRPELVLTVLDGLDVRVPRNVSRFLSEQKHARFLECRHRDARNFLQVRRERIRLFVYVEVRAGNNRCFAAAALPRRLLPGGGRFPKEGEVAASPDGSNSQTPRRPLLAQQRHVSRCVTWS